VATSDSAGGAYSAPTNPLAVFKRPTSKGREEEEEGEEEGGKKRGKMKGSEGKEWEGPVPPDI